ncbi:MULTISPECIES: GNAT family N-acetyltransferase [unclassified Streptomyces]|uniref:GNAT family N-acetyltransferase n=1 Tax=unclassified Streptomyces TaxID=2593676 RepID=UPI000AB4971A|nr:GNAT family N-acetyltransferase [Streptomyces sp. TSRI0107]
MTDTGGKRAAEAVEQAMTGAARVLRTGAERDWDAVTAGRLEWSCRATAEHLTRALFGYAGQLAGRGRHMDAYAPCTLVVDDGTDPAGLIGVLETVGALFTAAVRTTPPRVRAFHPFPHRSANREGFAAMGVAEVLLHTHDIAEGLGLSYEPPAELAEFALMRIFPEVRPGPAPWPTLLWATGRAGLPGREPVTDWLWSNNLVLPAGRLTLEGVTPAAAADLAAGGDGGFDWVEGGPYEGTREAAAMTLKAYETGVHRPEFGLFVLVRKEDERAVGGMGFHGPPEEDGRTEIGYDLAPSARGNGYATEALRALAAWALARPDVRSLFATVERANVPSQRVVARAGFRPVEVADVAPGGELLAYELRA